VTESYWQDATDAAGFLKAGFLGFQGSGKSITGMLLAIAAREHFKVDGPIVMFDTEGGSAYLRDHVQALTGKPLLVKRERSFDALMLWGRRALESGGIGLVDSISHPWREMCQSYLDQKNEARKRMKRAEQKRLEFEDWNVLKPRWQRWTDFYLNCPMHLIVCGRAGYEYDMEENEDTHKKELVKTGIKMKTEGEFGYEPSLLVQMILDRTMDRKERQHQVRRALVLKDRFMKLDGKEAEFTSTEDILKAMEPVRKFFMPHLELLQPGKHAPVDIDQQTQFNVDESGDSGWHREKKERTILCEEIQGELVDRHPGQSAADKKAKADLIHAAFNTRSWTAVENLHSDMLRKGLALIRQRLHGKPGDGEAPPFESHAAADAAIAAEEGQE
jgi:hypothetical protein